MSSHHQAFQEVEEHYENITVAESIKVSLTANSSSFHIADQWLTNTNHYDLKLLLWLMHQNVIVPWSAQSSFNYEIQNGKQLLV